jgi:hypothetical protein
MMRCLTARVAVRPFSTPFANEQAALEAGLPRISHHINFVLKFGTFNQLANGIGKCNMLFGSRVMKSRRKRSKRKC